MTMNSQLERDLRVLEQIEGNPDMTQVDLAARLDVAVGSVNWYLKRLINKGYVKVRQMRGRRLRYLITPQGIAEKARLTASFMQVSMRLYRETRVAARRYLGEIDVQVADAPQALIPTLRVEGMELLLVWPEMAASRPSVTQGAVAPVQTQAME
jgi:DNA-binding MarR family transcriptional regulator